ncbi:MAG TPA: hypothetical protein VJI46_00805 [Candidatus Nanoarchaeia archaeon]|nr:hypothetical protein [Candidatus Nanoarchaeia archaeon]
MKTVVFCECNRKHLEGKGLKRYYNKLLDGHFERLFRHNIIPTINRYAKEGEVSVIALDDESAWRLQNHGIAYKRASLDPNLKRKNNLQLAKFCRSIALKNSLLASKLLFLNMNFWELDEAVIMESLHPVIDDIRIVSSILDEEKPSRTVIFDAFSDCGRVIAEVAAKKGIKVDSHSTILSESLHHIRRTLLPISTKLQKPRFLSAIRNQRKRHVEPFFTSQNKRIIFVVATGKWGNAIRRISKNSLVIGRDSALKSSYSELNFRSFEDYATTETNGKIDFCKTYLPHYAALRDSAEFRSSFTFDGIRLWKILAGMFHGLLAVTPELVLSYYYVLEQIISSEKPSVIVIFGDRTKFGKTIIEAANQYQVPTLVIQPSLVFDRAIDGPTKAAKIAVFGQQAADYFASKGCSIEKCRITGNPWLDEILKRNYNPKGVRKKFNVPAGRKIVAVENGFKTRDILSALQRSRTFFPIPFEKEPYDILQASSIIITTSHIIEGLVLGKIVIVPSTEKNDLLENAGALYVSSDKIMQLIRNIKKSQTIKKQLALKYISYGNDGKSCQRISRLINSMVSANNINSEETEKVIQT